VVPVAWCLATLTYVLVRSELAGLTFAGPTAALFPVDQLRYLAWIRQAGLHLLIADPYRVGRPHVYLHPLFALSGLLWRAGISVQAAYLLWTPIALLALVWGSYRFAGLLLPGRERVAALMLSLLYFSPFVPLLDWGKLVNALHANYLAIVAGNSAAYWQAWGYLPTVIALGLMPLFLVAVSRVLDQDGGRYLPAGAAIAGLIVAWLHPWGGIELLAVVVALAALRRRASPGLAIAALGTAAPLAYYAVLAGSDAEWSLAQLRAGSGGVPMWWPLCVALGPLLVLALAGIRKPKDALDESLILWPAAALLAYVVLGADARLPALAGVALPLSVLAVRGWRRLTLPPAAGVAALLFATVPGAAYSAATFHDVFRAHGVPFALAAGEQRAIDTVGRLPGTVLATPYLAAAMPALDGRRSVTLSDRSAADDLFDGRVSGAALRHAIAAAAVKVVVADCLPGRVDLSVLLHPLGFRTRMYGCARVYVR
jgi:hypothetical protein